MPRVEEETGFVPTQLRNTCFLRDNNRLERKISSYRSTKDINFVGNPPGLDRDSGNWPPKRSSSLMSLTRTSLTISPRYAPETNFSNLKSSNRISIENS